MKATILCYHKVGPGSQEGRSLNIEPKRLASHVRFYSRRGVPFLLARELADYSGNGAVCFTFDDAYDSALNHASPLLLSCGVRATFYAVSSLVGQASLWDNELARPLASMDQLFEAQREGHEIGNHTASHLRLSTLSPEEQTAEIEDAHWGLSGAGLDVSTLCYPYGSYNAASIEIARRLGYRVGMSLRKGQTDAKSHLLELPRIVMAFSDTLPMLIYKTTLRPRLATLKGS